MDGGEGVSSMYSVCAMCMHSTFSYKRKGQYLDKRSHVKAREIGVRTRVPACSPLSYKMFKKNANKRKSKVGVGWVPREQLSLLQISDNVCQWPMTNPSPPSTCDALLYYWLKDESGDVDHLPGPHSHPYPHSIQDVFFAPLLSFIFSFSFSFSSAKLLIYPYTAGLLWFFFLTLLYMEKSTL